MEIELGLLREELGKDLLRTIEEIISRFAKKGKPYYILVYSDIGLDVHPGDAMAPQGKVMRVDGKTVIRTKCMVIDQIPPDTMMGTMGFRVDNKRGTLERLWVLPQNDPEIEGVEREDRVIEEVLDSARKVGPFIH